MIGKEFDKKVVHKGLEFKEMFLPINDQVFFVGEHTTILGEIGTMEAAIESTVRVSQLFE